MLEQVCLGCYGLHHYSWIRNERGFLFPQSKYEPLAICRTTVPGHDDFEFVGFSRFSKYYTDCELQTKRWILRELPSDGVFVDIGANVGILSACAAIKATAGVVIAIEPTDTFSLLVDNLSKPSLNRCQLHLNKIAIGSETETREDEIFQIWGAAPVKEKFIFKKLDDFLHDYDLKKVDVIKIDVDGYELEVLKGAIETLNFYSPRVIVEINEAMATRNTTHQQIFDFMLDQRYSSAHILDGSNFVFQKTWIPGEPWPNRISISSEREPFQFKKREQLLKQSLVTTECFDYIHDEVDVKANEQYVNILGSLPAWNYAASFRIFEGSNIPDRVVLRIEGALDEGEVGIAALNSDGSSFLSNEYVIDKKGKFEAELFVQDFNKKVVIRPVKRGSFQLRISNVTAYEIGNSRLSPDKTISSISITDSEELFRRLGFIHSAYAMPWLPQSDLGYLMEQTTAHFLATFYQIVKPRRHFEIGTWEGFGSQLALQNGAHEVWSLEKYEHSNLEYGSRYFKSKADFKPGWMISASNQNRFHQLFGTSRTISAQLFEPGFFDSILIDGSHFEQDVIDDTNLAISLTKRGNFVIWDDFPIFANAITRTREGVLQAIQKSLPELTNCFDLYAVRGTSLLIGVRKIVPG